MFDGVERASMLILDPLLIRSVLKLNREQRDAVRLQGAEGDGDGNFTTILPASDRIQRVAR